MIRRVMAIVLLFAYLGAIFGTAWLVLPLAQRLLLPRAPAVGWVIGPGNGFHLGASACVVCLLGPFVSRRAQRMMRESGIKGRKPGLGDWIAGIFVQCLFFMALLFYFTSWTVIDEGGVHQRALWIRRHYAFGDVRRQEELPEGYRAGEGYLTGHAYVMAMKDDFRVRVSRYEFDNPELSEETIRAIAKFVSERTGREWVPMAGMVRRK